MQGVDEPKPAGVALCYFSYIFAHWLYMTGSLMCPPLRYVFRLLSEDCWLSQRVHHACRPSLAVVLLRDGYQLLQDTALLWLDNS